MISSRLREARTQLGHTQESLAEMLDIDVRQIWRYENGETEAKGTMIVRIAKALHVSADWLLGLSDDPSPIGLDGNLSLKERIAISAWRKGDRLRAIKSIIEDE